MFIREAVEKAIRENNGIYRTSVKNEDSDVYATIKPTNTYEACLLIVNRNGEKKSCRNWNPTADDLMANDWEVTTE